LSDQPNSRAAVGSGARHSRSKRSRKKLIGGRVISWVGAIVGTAIVAFITAFATVLGTNTASHATSPAPPTGGPVQVTVGNVDGVDHSMALPNPVVLNAKQLNHLNSAWFSAHDYSYVGQVDIQLVVQGNRHHLVRIINISPVEKCSAPLGGTMFFGPNQGSDASARLDLDLDDPQRPAAYVHPDSQTKYPDYFGQYSVSLRFGDQFTFQVDAATLHRYCAFTLDLTIIDNGKTVTETANNHGEPFRLTALPPETRERRQGFSIYQVLYLSGEIANNYYPQPNTYGEDLWVRADPKKFLF
jgi:hypothetical protein